MTHPLIEAHTLSKEYTGVYSGIELAHLSQYLCGKPDTQAWRGLFEEQQRSDPQVKWAPIPYRRMIFPLWALLDYYKLTTKDAALKEKILDDETSLPPLELLASSL